jgi:uncharacterized protein (DUF2384 family)
MNTRNIEPAVATFKEVREVLGEVDVSVVTALQALGATREEIGEAAAWMSSDDYLHRKLHHTASGRVARVVDVLEEALQPPPERPRE